MKSNRIRVLTGVAAVAAIGIYAETRLAGDSSVPKNDPVAIAVQKGARWLASVQGKDGGWGQDGGETSYVRQGENLESTGNDVANTAVAAEALLHTGSTPTSGEYRDNLQRAVNFILKNVEQSPMEGLGVTNRNGTQIQRKLGPYIDTFLTSKLLAELDGTMGDPRSNARVRQSLEKCVAKVQKNQLQDGSWNIAGGWAPILGTSMASRSLFLAQQKGVQVSANAMAKVTDYTQQAATPVAGGPGSSATASVIGGRPAMADASAGVSLYQGAQALEQLSRTEEDRRKNAKQIDAIKGRLSDTRFVTGFGSMGGEEFFSYLNISDSLHRTGGPEWVKWNTDIKAKVLQLQNEDGTWAGHHCITGRVAVTSAAILTLLSDKDPVIQSTSLKRK
ncbi:MAG TPA: prenyltransferase/squalene oxidase repeat-containing protein [Bryobacteraceae bacterium]|nr:prenyltransferase/squalene oxidase repeat-containing protein [Bryobacteraceae bacterium]